MAGYSPTPLNKKLGLKPGMRLFVKNPPGDYLNLVAPLPDDAVMLKRVGKEMDFVHLFTKSARELERLLESSRKAIKQDGMIWVSWPKRASKVETDITEDTVRDIALPMGLVDIKVCAVDETWSGLKLVIRKELRS